MTRPNIISLRLYRRNKEVNLVEGQIQTKSEAHTASRLSIAPFREIMLNNCRVITSEHAGIPTLQAMLTRVAENG